MLRFKVLYIQKTSLLLILLFVTAMLFIKLNNNGVNFLTVLPEPAPKEYPPVSVLDTGEIPPYSDNLISLFPQKRVPVIGKPAPAPAPVKEVKADVAVPHLKFVGMIETDKKVVYSFRNITADRMVLVEEGDTADGIILMSVADRNEGRIFMFEIENTPFEVVK